MFENTIVYGSVIGVFCLAYSMNVAIETLRISNSDHGRVFGPRIAHSGIATLFSIAAVPCIFWPALYVGIFDGWVAGIVAWLGLQVLGGLATIILRIRGPLLGLHIVLGMLALPAGYFLTLNNPPWQEYESLTRAQGIPYQSEEFRDGDSRIPVIFACMFAGRQSGLDVGATETAMDFMLAMDVTPQQVDTWLHDATIYILQELAQTDWAAFWRSSCEEPFKQMRKTFSE